MTVFAAYAVVAGLITFFCLDAPDKPRDDLADTDEFAASLAEYFPSPHESQSNGRNG